jgi:hypothetical protein
MGGDDATVFLPYGYPRPRSGDSVRIMRAVAGEVRLDDLIAGREPDDRVVRYECVGVVNDFNEDVA